MGIRPSPDNGYTDPSYYPDPLLDATIITSIDATAYDSDGALPAWGLVAAVENLPAGAVLTWAASAADCDVAEVVTLAIAPNHCVIYWDVPGHTLGTITVTPSIDGVPMSPITMTVNWYLGS